MPVFDKRKEPFLQKYMIVVNHFDKQKEIMAKAELARAKTLQAQREEMELYKISD